MLFANKKSEGTPPKREEPKGLFIDREPRSADDDVLEVPAVPVTTPEPATQASGSAGRAGLRIRKAAVTPDSAPAQAAPEVASTDAKAKAGLFARFGAKKPTVEAVAGGDTIEDAPAPKAKAAKEKPAKAPKAEKPPKAPKEPKAPKVKRSAGKPATSVSVLAELDNSRQLYWTLTAEGLVKLDEAPAGQVYSFSREDHRFKTDKGLGYKAAMDVALQEVGEAVQVVNRTKDLRTVYATLLERAITAKHPLVPAVQVLDRLLESKGHPTHSVVCGFHLKGAQEDVSLVVLYYINADGEATKPQISVNPDSVDYVVTQFSTRSKVNKETTSFVLFDNAEFLECAYDAGAYPREKVWQGIPVRQILWGTAAVFAAAAIGNLGWAGYAFQKTAALKHEQVVLKEDITKTRSQLNNRLKASLPDFAKVMSLDAPALAGRAQSMWMPGARMVMTADNSQVKYEMWLPVTKGDTFLNRPSAMNTITAADHQKLVNFQAPEGCHTDGFSVAGGMNETELTIYCETGNPALARYRND